MAMIFYLTLLLVATLGNCNETGSLRDDSESNDRGEKEDAVAFETFGSPVYGTSNILPPGDIPLSGKSAYNYPIPPASLSNLPSIYGPYLSGLGVGNPYAYGTYNRYNNYPYTASSMYGYGASVPNALGYGSASYGLPGLGYTGYVSPFYRRSPYSDAYGYPGYSTGLGYRYAPAPVTGGPVARLSSPVIATPGVPRVPVSAVGISGPVASFSAPAPGVPIPFSAVSPYRSPVRPMQGKDGSFRYSYAL